MLLRINEGLCTSSSVDIHSHYLGMEWQGHLLILSATFLGPAKLFPEQLHHYIFSQVMCEDSDFFTSSPTFAIIFNFEYSHSMECGVEPHYASNLRFSNG